MKHQTTTLVILDGWGIARASNPGNAITPKTAPFFFSCWKKFPHTELAASGEAVGLLPGQEGNSEAGHLNLGAGRIVKQDAMYISDAVRDGTFFKNTAFHQALFHVKKYKSAVHVVGLLSNGNSAHSSPEQLYALLDLFHREKIERVYLHLFTDGRDSGQHDASLYLKKLETHFHGTERVATIMGRLYGMDRGKVWGRTERAYNAMVLAQGDVAESAEKAILAAYNRGETDEFISPTVISVGGEPVATVQDHDAIFFFNLRSDRARQLTKAFVQPDFEKQNAGAFQRVRVPGCTRFVAMTDFGPDLAGVLTAFPSRDIQHGLVATLAPRPQLYIAESEKFAHVTYFFNGGFSHTLNGEEWEKVPSVIVDHCDEQPKMSVHTVGVRVAEAIRGGQYEFICVNFANADMVGHTGNLVAAKVAVRAIDQELKRVVTAALKTSGQVIITADHGNAEEMLDLKTNEIDSEHSTFPVPAVVIATPKQLAAVGLARGKKMRQGILADVAPTLLRLMGIAKPKQMTGRVLW